jgi:uncharacterized protein (TIGR03000 family)
MLSWGTLKRFATTALAPAALMFAAVPAFAAHGGGHGGGGHGGGFHAGGYRGGFGGYRGGVGAYRGFGGYRGGYGLYRGGYGLGRGYYGGYGRGYGYGLGGYGLGSGLLGFGLGYGLGSYGLGYGLGGYGLGGYGYGGYGGYGSYGGYSYPSYYGSTYTNAPSYVGYSSYYPPVDTTDYVAPAAYNVEPATPDNEAHITLNVPANAEVWFDGDKTSQTGPTREFVSPPLTPGQTYTYVVRARWTENGRPVDQTRELHVRANQQTIENFPAGAGTTSAPPAGAAQRPPAPP